jgi:hypothetical protein
MAAVAIDTSSKGRVAKSAATIRTGKPSRSGQRARLKSTHHRISAGPQANAVMIP